LALGNVTPVGVATADVAPAVDVAPAAAAAAAVAVAATAVVVVCTTVATNWLTAAALNSPDCSCCS